ncbi:hypothetical protein V8F20_009513 [Naviculisporaceae sp. PSN 640]
MKSLVATASHPKKRAREDEYIPTHDLPLPRFPVCPFRLSVITHQRKKRRIKRATELTARPVRTVQDNAPSPGSKSSKNGREGRESQTSSEANLVSALFSPHDLSPRDSLKKVGPDHWEVLPSRLEEIPRCSTVEDACLSLINDRTDDIPILCQKLNQLSALVHQTSHLNRRLFELAMRMAVEKIIDSGHKCKWSGIDVKAAIYAARQAVNVAAPFGCQELWDWKLEVAFEDYECFTDELEIKRWTKFGLAMVEGKSALWNHFSLQGMLSTGLDFGFLPCKGLGWAVANFTEGRLYFLDTNAVTLSKSENYGMFSLEFFIPGAGTVEGKARVLFPQVSARQMLKRSKLNLEEWYNREQIAASEEEEVFDMEDIQD